MRNRFIRTLSPIAMAVVFILDIAVFGYGIFAIKKIIEIRNFYTITFIVFEIIAVIIAILVTKEIFSNGIKFNEKDFEFTGLDENNVFAYENIEEVETFKDTAASFTKNFSDRHTFLIITTNDEKVTTLDIGLTTNEKLKQITIELANRVGNDKININPIKKAKIVKVKKQDDNEEKEEKE